MTDIELPPDPGLDPGALAAAAEGAVAFPGEPGWDDGRRPVAVATPQSVAAVAAVLDVARRCGLRVAPEATGRAGGTSRSLDGALLLRTAALRGVEVDARGRRARVEGGAGWVDVQQAAGAHGLAPVAPADAGAGVAGTMLDGGVGWLSRALGLAASSVRRVDLLAPDGRLVGAHAGHEPELFWALRGGGRAPGVIVAVELALHPVPALCAGVLAWPAERRADVMRSWLEWTAVGVPDELTSALRVDHETVAVTAALLGCTSAADELMEPLRELAPALDTFAPVPVAALAALGGPPRPAARRQVLLLDECEPGVAELIAGSPVPGVALELRHLGGALAAAAGGRGALSRLPGELALVVTGPAGACDAAFASLAAALMPLIAGRGLPGDHPPAVRERLRRVHAAFDPHGVIC